MGFGQLSGIPERALVLGQKVNSARVPVLQTPAGHPHNYGLQCEMRGLHKTVLALPTPKMRVPSSSRSCPSLSSLTQRCWVGETDLIDPKQPTGTSCLRHFLHIPPFPPQLPESPGETFNEGNQWKKIKTPPPQMSPPSFSQKPSPPCGNHLHFVCLSPISQKSWVSICLPRTREAKNLCKYLFILLDLNGNN